MSSSTMLTSTVSDERDALALHALHEARRPPCGRSRGNTLAIIRVGLEDQTRAALPFLQAKRAGADGARAQIRPSGLTTSRAAAPTKLEQVAHARIVGLRHPDLQRVAVERAQALDRRVEIELARLLRRLDDGPRAEDQVGEDRTAGAASVGIEPALVRIDVVLGGELARLALERRIVGEQDSALQPDRPHAAAVRDFRRLRRRSAA